MRSIRLALGVAAALAAGVLPLLAGGGWLGGLRPGPAVAQGAYQAVPKADCAPGDRVETGLQGQTTLAERTSGASMQAYTCNLELVGQFTGEGAGWQHAWFDDCAYYGTTNNPTQQHPGVAVIDVSDPRNPQATAYLNDRALAEPWESLKVNERRRLLGGVQANNGRGVQPGFSLYDISGDCSQPKLITTVDVEPQSATSVGGHAGDFAPDGLTYYGTGTPGGAQARSIYPIDISDPANPKMLARWDVEEHEHSSHDLTVSKDGTRLYAAQSFSAGAGIANGLVILDVSQVQNRVPNPQPVILSEIFWPDGRGAQQPTQVRIKGRPYILFSDEAGSMGTGQAGRTAACAAGLPPHGFARLIDVSDDTKPFVTSLIMLEVHDPANCPLVVNDTPISFGYDAHYCTVDNPENGKVAACSFFQSGIRVFDIRDPYNPREIAYYKPPAMRTAPRPGSDLADRIPDRTADWAASNTRFVKYRGEDQLWITSQDNGFQVLRFTKRIQELLKPDKPEKPDKPGKPGKGKGKGN